MPRLRLTDRYVDAIRPPASGREEYADELRVGLRLRVSYSGSKIWYFEKRIKGGPKRKHKLGPYPTIGIGAAREMAAELELEAIQGVDRVALAKEASERQSEQLPTNLSVREVLDIYYRLHVDGLRTVKERKRSLEKSFSTLLSRPIGSITRHELQSIIDKKAASGAKVQANRVKSELSAFANFAWKRDYLPEKIGAQLTKSYKEVARDRVLSLAEIREIWSRSFEMGDLWGPILRLLILTVQRRSNISELVWPEVNFEERRIEMASGREKNAKSHKTHLSDPAFQELRALKKRAKTDAEWVFSTTGKTPVSGHGKMKKKLDKLLGNKFEPWTIHDIRTAFATAMAESGEAESVVDRILNHVASGSAPSAVARVYNQAELLPERARVLDKWAEMVTGTTAEIVRFGR